MVSIVEEISLKSNILEGAITIVYDGLNTIKRAMEYNTIYSCLSNHFKLIAAIDHNILKYTLIWYWRHVKGHQDDQTVPLYRWSSLNLEYETVAKKKWK